MPQDDKDFKGTSSPTKWSEAAKSDKNQAMPQPSPADSDKNKIVQKPDMKNALPFGLNKKDMSPIGPSIFDKSE